MRQTTTRSRYCMGPVAYGTDYLGRLETTPGPTAGMGGLLRMYTSGNVAATYNLTGP
jgi:hypothetical protein